MLGPRVSRKLPSFYTRSFRSLLPSTLLFTSLAFTYRWRPSDSYASYTIGKHGFRTVHGRYPFTCQAGGSSNNEEGEGFRVNKCFAAFASRREADKFVMYGRVKVNGVVAQPGMRVRPGDKVWGEYGRIVTMKNLMLNRFMYRCSMCLRVPLYGEDALP